MAMARETQTHEMTDHALLSSDIMTSYNLYYTTSRMNVTLHQGPKSSPAIFYGQTKCLRAKPIVLLREGDSKKAPVRAHAQIPWTMVKTMYIGLGDGEASPESEADRRPLQREKNFCHRSDYAFTWEGEPYTWVKDKSKRAATAYQCMDENGKELAKMLSGGAFNWSKGGEIEVRNGLDKELECLLIAGALGIWAAEAISYGSIFKAY